MRAGLVFVKDAGNHFAAVDASGTSVASYTPAAEPPPGTANGTPSTVVNTVAASTASPDLWSVFADYYETVSGESPDIYAGAEDLWLVVDGEGRVAPKTLSLRKEPGTPGFTIKPERDYAASSTGAYVLYTESGALHALRVDSGSSRTLATDFVMDRVNATIRHKGKWVAAARRQGARHRPRRGSLNNARSAAMFANGIAPARSSALASVIAAWPNTHMPAAAAARTPGTLSSTTTQRSTAIPMRVAACR